MLGTCLRSMGDGDLLITFYEKQKHDTFCYRNRFTRPRREAGSRSRNAHPLRARCELSCNGCTTLAPHENVGEWSMAGANDSSGCRSPATKAEASNRLSVHLQNKEILLAMNRSFPWTADLPRYCTNIMDSRRLSRTGSDTRDRDSRVTPSLPRFNDLSLDTARS